MGLENSSYQTRLRKQARAGLLARLLGVLGNTDQPVLSYVWRAWLMAFIPSLVISAVVTLALALLSNKPAPTAQPDVAWFLLLALVAPWLETLFMWPILCILRLAIHRTIWVALASGLVWGYFHSYVGLTRGLTSIWSFFIFSICFLEWEKRSPEKAYVVTALVHTCQNLPGALYLLSCS